MLKTAHWMQWVIVAMFGVYLAGRMIMAGTGDSDRDFHYKEFAALPVVDKGRLKPFDTVARGRLTLIQGNSTVKELDDMGRTVRTWTPEQWLLDVLSLQLNKENRLALNQKIFRIDNKDVLSFMHIEPKQPWRYAYYEFLPQIDELRAEVKHIEEDVEPKSRTVLQAKLMELASHIHMFEQLFLWDAPGIIPAKDGHWFSIADARKFGMPGQGMHPIAEDMLEILVHYSRGDVKEFNAKVKEYRLKFEKEQPSATSTAALEAYFNHLEPFYHCAVL